MHISDNEIYLLIKYIKTVLCRVAKCLAYIEDARCLKVKLLIREMVPKLPGHPLKAKILASPTAQVPGKKEAFSFVWLWSSRILMYQVTVTSKTT